MKREEIQEVYEYLNVECNFDEKANVKIENFQYPTMYTYRRVVTAINTNEFNR